MKIPLVIKVVILVSLLSKQQTTAARPPCSSGVEGLWDHDQHRQMGRRMDRQVKVSWWLSEDYSLPRRRRPIHNNLDP
ncbi:hypothetical protein F0562_004869 [Nyssa sinensis]|uniref:Uncharacterized protein n=1 Tax=Nyssa sinensis TaxID=561372 RepID=A0A5J5AHV2_9ASTE|nr:hypothetical protein F0562_004869 [Nyssa sinensis]